MTGQETAGLNIRDVEAYLPQRPPILMLDEVVDIEPGVSGVGRKKFNPEDPYFEGHFPERPILPGVLSIEALAQTALVVLSARREDTDEPCASRQGFLAKVDQTSFYKIIEPGQEIAFHVRMVKSIKQFTVVEGKVFREDVLIAKGQLTLALESAAQ